MINIVNNLCGDEYVRSFGYSRLPYPWTDASLFIRCIWTSYQKNNVRLADVALSIWYLPNEKMQGLPVLSRKVVQLNSRFWNLPPEALADYIGSYLGVPHPIWRPRRLLTLAAKLPRLLPTAMRLLSRPVPAT